MVQRLGPFEKIGNFQPDKATLLNSIPKLELSRNLERPKKRKKQISKSKLRGLLGFHAEQHPPFLVGTSVDWYVGRLKPYPFRKSMSSKLVRTP